MKRIVALMLAVAFCPLVGGAVVSGFTAADLFDSSVLQRLDLRVHSADWAKLKQDFKTNEYYPADMVWNGQTVHNVGIRSRGLASRSGIKPGLRVDFNRYATNQTFLGLKSLVLDNLVQDPSGIHEAVSMWLFNRMGIPAPREAHARLYVNGEYSGVYAVVEPVDKVMLARVFGSNGGDVLNDGYLFEFDKAAEWHFNYLGSDLAPYKTFFTAKTHESEPDEDKYRPIETIVRTVNDTPPERLTEAIGRQLDLKGFVRYLAVQNFLAENDGFVGEWGMNNFYLYRREHSDEHVFIAWDDDLSFKEPAFDVMQRVDSNVLASRVMQVPEYRALYLSTLQEAADQSDARVDGSDLGVLETEIRRRLDLIDEAMRLDTFRPFTDTDYTTGADLMKQFATQRIRYVTCEVARLTNAPGC